MSSLFYLAQVAAGDTFPTFGPNNIANGSNSADNGGGIYLEGATLFAQTNNVLTGNQSLHSGSAIGIYSGTLITSMSLTGSCIFGNGGVSISNPLPVAFDATNNWWGSPDGPSIGGGSGGDGGAQSIAYPSQDSISGNINKDNWQGEAPGICPQQTASTPIATAPPTNTPYPTDTPMPTPTPCYATVIGPSSITFRQNPDKNPNGVIFRIDTGMNVVQAILGSPIQNSSIVRIRVAQFWRISTVSDPRGGEDTVTWLDVVVETTNYPQQSLPGFIALRSTRDGELLRLDCNENTLPNYPAPTPTPGPTSTPIALADRWYVACESIVNPGQYDCRPVAIHPFQEGTPYYDSTHTPEIEVGEWIEHASLDGVPSTITISGSPYSYVLISWNGGLYWIVDRAIKQAGPNGETDCLSVCPAQPRPTPTPMPLPTATPVPLVCPAGVSTYTPVRFSLDRQTQTPLIYTDLFDLSQGEQVAHIGSYGFHYGDRVNKDGATLDIMPASLEECSDSQNCTSGQTWVPVYLPVRAAFVPTTVNTYPDSMNFLIDNVEGGQASQITWNTRGCETNEAGTTVTNVVGRREIFLEHITPDPGFLAAHDAWGGLIPAGTLIGYVQVPSGYIENPSNSPDAFHLAFQLRFYSSSSGYIQACHDEVLGVLTASGRQVIDDWQNGTGKTWDHTTTPNDPTRIRACQAQ